MINQATIKAGVEAAKKGIPMAGQKLADFFSKDEALELVNQATTNCEVKKGLVMKSLRAALFGTLNGPDLIQSWVLLSRFSKDRARISRLI